MNWCSGSLSTSLKSSVISASVILPKALSNMVTGLFRLRSTFTDITSLGLVSNSIQAPRLGISLADARGLPEVGSFSAVKYTPGDLTSWLTTTLSAPFIIKVPDDVIIGISPTKRSCILRSPSFGPGALLTNSTLT